MLRTRVESDEAVAQREGLIRRSSQLMVNWAERWFPDTYVFVVCICIVVAIGATLHTGQPIAVSRAFGDGFWSIIPFTMQMTFVVIGGYVVAMSPPADALLRRLARIPRTSRGAIVFVASLSILMSLINWGVSLIFSGLLVREIARREGFTLDYRAAGAAAYLGLGCTFTLGLSSSPAQLQANASSLPPDLRAISGVIGFNETILTWQNAVVLLTVMAVSLAISFWTAPSRRTSVTAEELGVDLRIDSRADTQSNRPGDRLEFSPVLTIAVAILMSGWVWNAFASGSPFAVLSQLNTYNLLFLMLGLLLHWRPRSFLESFRQAVPAASGILLQFPFYGGIGYMLTKVVNAHGSSASDAIAHCFIGLTDNTGIFSILVGVYSAVLGFFVPSAGGKWLIEAPYIMSAANQTHAHLGWTVMVYNITETLPSLINPFWMLPLLGILKLKPKDIVGYTTIQFLIHAPLVILVAAALMLTFTYHAPVLPPH
ncbi:TIGR00366 family protein [Caballeronia insecticola]|uniref:Short-chain fatty acids transporter n=1 Tax=Caballeronia insecticola TaxID=758793 RepID=A0A060PJV3_9BURK|nr:TIGR00366 family protein [Caballeronia insecticola]BAO94198.1 short-chain fatty acids transporter [Caballeronia insecticola]